MFPRVIRQASQRGNCHSTSAIWFLLAPRMPIFLRKSKRCRKVTSLRTCVNILSRIHKFPKTFIGGRNRSFKHDWQDQAEVWLYGLIPPPPPPPPPPNFSYRATHLGHRPLVRSTFIIFRTPPPPPPPSPDLATGLY